MADEYQEGDVKLSDVVDINFLQELQDNFAKIFGVASITVDLKGPVTKPSNFTDFCIKYTRGSESGYKRCNECDINCGKIAAEKGQAVIYDCHAGLTDFAVPIIVNNKQIGSILGGQILTQEPDEEKFRALARELGIDEQEYIEALKKIKIVPKEKVEAAAQILFLVANAISETAAKNIYLTAKNKRENALRKVFEAISGSLDSNRIKNIIVNEVAKALNPDVCLIATYDNMNDYFYIDDYSQYKSRETDKDYVSINTRTEGVKWFMDLFRNNKETHFTDVEEYIKENNLQNTAVERHLKEYNIKSGYDAAITYGDQLLGYIVIQYTKDYKTLNSDDLSFLKSIAAQAGVVINQANLYKQSQLQVERETILRKIIEATRSSLDTITVKQNLVNELGAAFKADRCYFRAYDKTKDKFSPPDVEYLSSSDIPSLLNVEPHQEGLKYFSEELRKRSHGFYPVVANADFAKGTPLEDYMKSAEMIADYAMPIIDREEGFTWLVLHYSKEDPRFDEDHLKLLETIAYQIDNTLEQLKLYDNTKKIAKRETLLRKINETISSTLDIDTIIDFICIEVAKLFNVQRAIVVEFPYENNYSNYIIRREYKSREDIRSIKEIDPDGNASKYWGEKLCYTDNVLAFDNISEADAPQQFKNAYAEIGVKSAIGIAIKEDGKIWGEIVLFEYDNYRHWSDEEITLLNAIAGQIYISIQQSKLYLTAQQQIEREKAILNNMPFMAWLKDDKGRFLTVNELFAKQCNLKVEEIVGKSDLDIQPEELAKKYMEDDRSIMETGQQIKIEEQIAGPDEVKWYETFKTPVFDQNGTVIGTTGCSRDITEQKEVDRMKNEFVSIISHELRTPLTSIRGALGLVSSNALGILPDKVNSLLTIASNNTIRLINLINDILDMEKIKAGKMDFNFDEYEVMALLEESIKLNEEYARQYNVTFEIGTRLDNALINIDKDRFIQVITNLLSNAAKFSYQNETVSINVQRNKNQVSISVVNKGHGIPEESVSKIFQSFSQVDSSDARQKGGTGLGLSISKSIIERMGGTIGFISKVQESTTFYIKLPEIQKNDVVKTVLICEDNKTTAMCIKSMFESLGYNADLAFRADEASKLLIERHYDLMTLDLLLPDRDGLTLLEELKWGEKTKYLPVLIISVKKPDLKLIKKNHQIVDWLEKSFKIEDLEQSIQKIMHNKNTNKVKILHVENDVDILKLIDLTLRDIAIVTPVKNLTKASEVIKETAFDIIILDYVFPEGTSDKLIPAIKSGHNKDAKVIVFSAYEESKILARYVDSIFLKTDISNEKFRESIQTLIDMRQYEKEMKGSSL